MTTQAELDNRLSYWCGYKAALHAVKSVVDFKAASYIDTVIIPNTEKTIAELESKARKTKEVNE